ncbi:hypothetical protein AVEN_132749-1, partial [Araneus ventricosus]
VDFLEPRNVSAVVTKGIEANDYKVTKYKVTYSDDAEKWLPVTDDDGNVKFNKAVDWLSIPLSMWGYTSFYEGSMHEMLVTGYILLSSQLPCYPWFGHSVEHVHAGSETGVSFHRAAALRAHYFIGQ